MNPRATIQQWQQQRSSSSHSLADALRKLGHIVDTKEYLELREVVLQICQISLAEPHAVADPLAQSRSEIERLIQDLDKASDPEACRQQLAAIDLLNIASCAGVSFPPEVARSAARWVPDIRSSTTSNTELLRVGCAALASGDLSLATFISESLLAASPSNADRMSVMLPAMIRTMQETDPVRVQYGGIAYAELRAIFAHMTELIARGQLDEPTLLWCFRIVFEVIMKQPPASILETAHRQLWQFVEDFERDREASEQEAKLRALQFPKYDTLGKGRYRAEQLLLGDHCDQQLWLGRDRQRDVPVLISVDYRYDPESFMQVRSEIGYSAPGVLELLYLGDFDPSSTSELKHEDCDDYWAIIEQLGEGEWLPSIWPTEHEPQQAVRMALDLGRSLGEILDRAAQRGVVLAAIRPEYIWAEHLDGRWRVTNVTARGEALFKRAPQCMGHWELFDRSYDQWVNPQHALIYPLAVMIGEWATGEYLTRSPGRQMPIGWELHLLPRLPSPLRELLAQWLRNPEPPTMTLREFLDELDRVAAHFE